MIVLVVAFVALVERVLAMRTRQVEGFGIVDFVARQHPLLIGVQALAAAAVLWAVTLSARRSHQQPARWIAAAGVLVYAAVWAYPDLMATKLITGM